MENKSKISVGMTLLIVGIMLLAMPVPYLGAEEPQQNNAIPMSSTIHLNGYVFDFTNGEPRMNPALMAKPTASGEVGVYIVHMTGPIYQEWVDAIGNLGVEIVEYVHNFAYQVRMTPEQALLAGKLPFIDWVGSYHPAYKISPDLSNNDVVVYLQGKDISQDTIDNIRSEMAVFEEGTTHSGYTLRGRLTHSAALDVIAANAYVQYITPTYEDELMDEAGMQIVGGGLWVDDNDANHNTPYRVSGTFGSKFNQVTGLSGTGITVGIADTGLGNGAVGNAGHVDFNGRVIGGMTYSGTTWEDGHGHGTHCAGLIAANGAAGTGRTYAGFGPYYAGLGLAYGANLYAQKIFSNTGSWIGPTDRGMILVNGYAGGARLHSNSWGANTGGAYDGRDAEYDARARDADPGTAGNQQILAIVAAGNAGSSANTVGSPGVAKNVLTVAATQNYMPDSRTYGNTDVNVNNPDAIVGFSSRGWTDDGRVKPEIAAPGQSTLSTHSPSAGSNLYGYYSADNRYEWCSGTSQATPTVAGGATVTYQWFQQRTGSAPSPAMVKALVINTAKDIGTADIPNQAEGWGRMYLTHFADRPSYFYMKDRPGQLTTGAYHEYQVSYIDPTQPFKVTLVWPDVAAATGANPSLRNDLRLQVFAPLGQEYRGNAFSGGWTPAGTNPITTFDSNSDGNDDRNNVENVFIPTTGLQTGLYTVRVSGFNIVADFAGTGSNNQEYALVVYNGIDVTSKGTVDIQHSRYPREASVQVEVKDADLNTNANVQTVTINIKSNAEPAGESMVLTETGGDTGIFRGTKTISATNSNGVLWVNAADVITATYNDANDGTGSSAVVTDTAIVDGTAPASPTGLAVEWFGVSSQTLINQDFSSTTFPPTGWAQSGPSNQWTRVTSANAGGTSPEARFGWVNTVGVWRLYAGPFNTNGMASLALQWRQMVDAYGAGITLKVQTSSDLSNWNDAGWSWISGTSNYAAKLDTLTLATADVGSSTFYLSWTADGNAYQIDYWYIDNVLLTYSGGGLTDDNRLTWTKSADDGAGANDLDHYDIYRASTSAGPWNSGAIIATAPPGSTSYIDYGKGEFDGVNWWYVVRAVDDLGNSDTNTNAVPEQLPSGATATATGPIGGPSNVAGITITYSWTGSPTSVRLFRTTTGGSTWTLIGTDSSVDGSYAWTISSGAGTYGWIAVAVGGSTTETDPAGGTTPEAASYIFDNVAPTITATTFADGATGVATTAGNYDATFSESMQAVGTFTTNLPGASGSWINPTTYRIAYTALSYSTTYTTTYNTNYLDLAGNALGGDRVKDFTTQAAPAATATATGPTGGPTTVTAITLTYTYTGTPTSVNLYYTTTGGTSWTLAGNDGTVDGSYAWTCPGSGTYGWIASAVGGGSTEPSPPSGGTLPESSSYIVDVTPPSPPTGLTVHHWGPEGSDDSTTETRYMRGDQHTVNTILGYQLGTTQSATAMNSGNIANSAVGRIGIRVWKVGSSGAETEITSGTAVAVAGRDTAGTSTESATWTPPQTALASSDSVVVRVYADGGTGTPVTERVIFTTSQLGATQLDGSQWTVYYHIRTGTGGSQMQFYWGTTAQNSRIEGFAYSTIIPGNPADHNTLNWTASPSGDLDHYNVYRSDSEFGTYSVIDTVPAGTNTYVDLNMGQADATYWWYKVRAVDALSNEELNNNAVQEPAMTPPTPYTIGLAGIPASSWVFVSFPSDITGNIWDVLNDATSGDGLTTWTVAKGWDNAAKTWRTYRVGGTANTLTTIDNTRGVWLWLTANGGDQVLTLNSYVANPSSAVNINLYTGWNMVGYPSATSRLASATLPAQADMVSVWQAASPYVSDISALNTVTMSHGNAYWVRVTADCTWVVQP